MIARRRYGCWPDLAVTQWALRLWRFDSVPLQAGGRRYESVLDLLVVGNNWWLERHNYDGSEWWEFKRLPTRPLSERRPQSLFIQAMNASRLGIEEADE